MHRVGGKVSEKGMQALEAVFRRFEETEELRKPSTAGLWYQTLSFIPLLTTAKSIVEVSEKLRTGQGSACPSWEISEWGQGS